jgi:very-short-patch-repair endonuclease
VEIDGDAHLYKEKSDYIREQMVIRACFIVQRFTNDQLYESMDFVPESILSALQNQ